MKINYFLSDQDDILVISKLPWAIEEVKDLFLCLWLTHLRAKKMRSTYMAED
jgi:hypothetical protein